MSIITIFIVSFLSGIFASMGLGGGMVLILYLVFFASVSQLSAQGINLVFFIPIAILSIIMHKKAGFISLKSIIPSIITGIIFSVIFSFIAVKIDTGLLSKLFGGFVTAVGIRQLTKSR